MSVHFIGAGPGAPDLITVRGLKIIKQVGVVLYAGSLVPEAVVAEASSGATVIDTAPLHLDEIINEMYMVAEGVKSAPAVIALAEKYKIQMPIAEEVYNVTRGNSSARNAFRGLLRAEIGAESEPG